MHSTPSDVIAAQIKKHRERLGLTRDQLAEECAKLGAPQLTFAALTNVETGRKHPKTGQRRRQVSVDELLVLSYALAVPPLLLVFPLGELDEIPAPPHWKGIHPRAAWKWAMGEQAPGYVRADGKPHADNSRIGDEGPTRFDAWRRVVWPIELHQLLSDATEAYLKATGQLTHLESIGQSKSDEANHASDVRQHHLNQIARTLEEMMTAGLSVPSYRADTAEDIRSTGLLSHPEMLPVIRPQKKPNHEGES
jgi:hypothetical protein